MLLDTTASLASVDQRLDQARMAWHQLTDQGHLRMAELARNQLDTLLDIRYAVEHQA